MIEHRGLPKALQDEVELALRPIIARYAAMQKSHMNLDRMRALVGYSVDAIFNELWENRVKSE